MKELLTLNIRYKYFSLIPRDLIGNQCGESESSSIIKIEVDTSSSFYDDILKADLFVRDKLKDDLFWWWKYKRIYSAIELSNARLRYLQIGGKASFTSLHEERKLSEQPRCGINYRERDSG